MALAIDKLISGMNSISAPIEDKSYKVFPKINLEEPDEELLKWAKENIDEDPQKRAQLIEELRDLVFERGECVPVRTDDVFLLRFLRARNFIVKLSHRLLVNYTTLWDTNPEFFDVNYDNVIDLAHEHVFSVPPYVDQDGRRLLIARIGEWNPSRFSSNELFQLLIIIFQIALIEPRFQILGGQCIVDLTDVSLAHAWYMSPTVAKQVIQITFKAMPIRIKAIHIINTTWIFDKVFGIIRQFLTDFMQEVIFFHEDLESLHQHIDPKYLPRRYGGVHDDYPFSSWIMGLKNEDQVVAELESLGYDGYRDAIQGYVPKQQSDENEIDDEF